MNEELKDLEEDYHYQRAMAVDEAIKHIDPLLWHCTSDEQQIKDWIDEYTNYELKQYFEQMWKPVMLSTKIPVSVLLNAFGTPRVVI